MVVYTTPFSWYTVARMSTPQLATDISIELSFFDGRPLAEVYFREANITQTIYWVRRGGEAGFLEGVEQCVTSTVEQIYPPIDKSGENLAQPASRTITVSNHSEHPVAPELFRTVQNITERIMKEWKEMMAGTDNQNAS